MTKWLRFNLGIDRVDGYEAVHPTNTTPFHYYGGWEFDANSNQIQHAGNLENYSSFIVMDSQERTGVVVLANLNSTYTTAIGEGIMSLLKGEPVLSFNDWMPNTTLYGALVLLGALTLFTINTIARLIFRLPRG